MYYLCNNRVFHSETALVLQSLALVRMDTRKPFPKPCCQLHPGGGVQSSWFKIESGVRQRCMLAPDSFATSMDWMMERTVGQGINDVSFGRDSYADLDFAGDASLLAELLELLIPVLEMMASVATLLGFEVNWQKTKVQAL